MAKLNEGRPVGRPSDFKPEFCGQVEKLCRLGATDKDIADFFEKAESTINLWKQKHPEFSESIKRGKVLADMEVANALYKKATGYVIEVEKIIGRGDNREVVKLNVAVEPDTTAQIFWLTNRQRDNWKHKQQIESERQAALDAKTTDGTAEENDERDYLADLGRRFRLPSLEHFKAEHKNGHSTTNGNGHNAGNGSRGDDE